MPRRQLVFLIGIVALTIAASVMTVVWRNEPLLGLDLQGGVSVRLAAVGPADEEMLDKLVRDVCFDNAVEYFQLALPAKYSASDGARSEERRIEMDRK